MSKLSIKDLDLSGKTVFIRVDFNVPLSADGKEITSDKRIRASLPTIQYALEQNAGVVLASHLGRPKGKPRPEMSLKPIAARLQELLGKPGDHGAGLRGRRNACPKAEARPSSAAGKPPFPSRKKKLTIPLFPSNSPRSRIYMLTTPLAPPTAPMPPPLELFLICQLPPPAY